MHADRPIIRLEDDRLGFSPIAEQLARAILELRAPKGFVLGIEGQWGSGKTTLINLTVTALGAHGSHGPEIVFFSPWLVGDRDELLQALFNELALAAVRIDPVSDRAQSEQRLGWWKKLWRKTEGNAHWRLHKSEQTKKALGPKLRAFGAIAGTLGKIARTADALGVPVAGLAGSALERSGEAAQLLLAKEPLSKRKAELVEALDLLARRIVVFVDDLDRLEPQEASEVLRLIRAVADFPNIIYVLSYDPKVVAQILSKAMQVDDGAAFLEKIVQVSFRIPQPEAFDLRRWFRAELRELFDSHWESSVAAVPSLESRLAQVIDSEGGRYLKTGRDVVRVLNALQLHAIPVLDSIDIADMVWLQLVKIGNARLYDWVEQYLTELGAVASGRGISVSRNEEPGLIERLNRLLADESENLDLAYIELGLILPGLDHEHRNGELHRRLFAKIDGDSLARFIAEKRLGSPQHYRYYFAFAQPIGALTDTQLESFVRLAASNPVEAGSMFAALTREARPQGGTLADVLIDRLNALGDRLPPTAGPGVIHVLSNFMDTSALAVAGDFNERFAWRAATRLLKSALGRTSTNTRGESLRLLFERGSALGWLTSIIREEIFAHGLHGDLARPQSDWILSADEFSAALNVMLDRYRNTPAVELRQVPELLNLLYAWREAGYPDEVRQWVVEQIRTDEGLLAFLSRVRGWMGVNGVLFYPLKRGLHPVRLTAS